jgi:hypothetical protein
MFAETLDNYQHSTQPNPEGRSYFPQNCLIYCIKIKLRLWMWISYSRSTSHFMLSIFNMLEVPRILCLAYLIWIQQRERIQYVLTTSHREMLLDFTHNSVHRIRRRMRIHIPHNKEYAQFYNDSKAFVVFKALLSCASYRIKMVYTNNKKPSPTNYV